MFVERWEKSDKNRVKKEGGELISIKKDGKEYLHDGKEFWNRHAPILFPIVGMIKDNKTSILGKTYEMKQHGLQEIWSLKKF